MRIVVTGTDTGVGKTVFCAGLAGMLGARYWKPVQAGTPGDSETVAELAGVEVVPEAYRRNMPASPHRVWEAMRNGSTSAEQQPQQAPLTASTQGRPAP